MTRLSLAPGAPKAQSAVARGHLVPSPTPRALESNSAASSLSGGAGVAAGATAAGSIALLAGSRARRRRHCGAGLHSASKVSKGKQRHIALAAEARNAKTAVAPTLDDAPEMQAMPGADEEASVLCDSWARALEGYSGDVWTEPELVRSLAEKFNSGPGDDAEGPIRFERVSAKRDESADLVLYVPGIDFSGLLSVTQFPKLAKDGHEVWRCWVGSEDRSAFRTLADSLATWLRRQIDEGRRVVLVGESFGGLLGLAVALRLGKALKGLVLVNPATSFERTPWALLGRFLAALPAGDSRPLSKASSTGELLQQLGERARKNPYAYVGYTALTGAVIDGTQLGRVASRVGTTAMERMGAGGAARGANPFLEVLLESPENLAKLLPPELVSFRLRAWLRDGCELVNSQLRLRPSASDGLPAVLLLSSSDDRLLGSMDESRRLKPFMEERCGRGLFQAKTMEDAGHNPLDDRVDLAALIRASPIYTAPPKGPDYVNDFRNPSLQQIEEGSKAVEGLASFVSPVFFSLDASGAHVRGLDSVPAPQDGRPVLLVGNHQLLGLDLQPLIREFLIEKGYAPRGLAHPVVFPETLEALVANAKPAERGGAPSLLDALGLPFELRSAAVSLLEATRKMLRLGGSEPSAKGKGKGKGKGRAESLAEGKGKGKDEAEETAPANPFTPGSFADWGAVPVSPRNFFKLMQKGETVLLFPGGAREACHGFGENYQVIWPEKVDFVRVAARFNAVIVPFGGVGSADNFRILDQGKGVGQFLRSAMPRLPGTDASRRRPMMKDDGLMPVSESLTQPLEFPGLLPRLPPAQAAAAGLGDRFYFSFGSPVDLGDLDPNDKEGCLEMYNLLRGKVEGEIDWLLRSRVRDPYRDFQKRQTFERIANLDPEPRVIKAGPLKGQRIRNYGRRAPTFNPSEA
mmetsp:Transcript_69886/g.152030  ORF Transcript_69886/g.152030 Transcript_69886/m.152030 type:complete len:919 (+) Transcript_69886:47-2803(+)